MFTTLRVGRNARSLIFLEKGVNPMTKFKKRATALLLGSVTFFIALVMPYNTTRVYAADVAFSWVVNESSNTILNWILLYLGISVAPEAISEGKVFDKTGQFAMDFCQEFFGDTFEQWYVSNGFSEDIDTFKREFNDILTQDFDAAKYVAGDVKSSVLDIVNSYLTSGVCSDMSMFDTFDFGHYASNCLELNQTYNLYFKTGSYDSYGKPYTNISYGNDAYRVTSSDVSQGSFYCFNVFCQNSDSTYNVYCLETAPFNFCNATEIFRGIYYHVTTWVTSIDLKTFYFESSLPSLRINSNTIASLSALAKDGSFWDIFSSLINDKAFFPNIDIPDVAGKDYAYDLVGWPNTWDIDKPDVKPWDGVDSLPIPGDVVLGDSIPGVIDFPDVIQKIIDGTIPWPDVIGAVRDIDIPAPDPDPDEPDKKPDPDPELPEIPAVLPQGVSDKLKDLSGKFPFCIPFDVVDCYKSFATKDNAEAPKWDIDFTIPGTNQKYHFSVDLAMFDKYIPIFRSGVLILFFIGLLLATRKLIGWQIDN